MSVNESSVKDDYGLYSNWIELYNYGDESVDLEGVGLTDNPNDLFKWVFPAYVMNPGEHLVIWASGHDVKPVDGYVKALMYERYENIPGTRIDSLLNHPSYPDNPTQRYLLRAFDAPAPVGEYYGARLQGMITPPETGNYVFWLTSDNRGQLFLSTDETESGLETIASVPGWTRPMEWEKYPEQRSVEIFLEKGKKYFIRALMKKHEGIDHLTVRWQLPCGKVEEPISSMHLLWEGGNMHTNFDISRSGETLTLTRPDGVIMDQINSGNIPPGISYGRQPDGTGEWVYFDQPTPWGSNIGYTYADVLKAPFFSTPGGIFPEEFDLQLFHTEPGVTVFYTLDGSEPSPSNLDGSQYFYKRSYRKDFSDPVVEELISRESITRVYKDSIPVRNLTGAAWSQTDVNTRWEKDLLIPRNTPVKGTVVRAVAYKEGFLPSEVVSQSYIIRSQRYPLPVVSIILPESFLFDYEKGIYVAGRVFDEWRAENWDTPLGGKSPANWSQKGDDWEREINIEYFNPEGDLQFNQRAGLSLHGAWSRSYPQKSFRLYARGTYGTPEFDYPFFPDKGTDKFKRLILRAAGQDHDKTFFRDAFNQRLVKHRPIDIQHWQPVISFINGEYWGVLNVRDRIDKYYIAYKYNLDAEKLDILSMNSSVNEGDNLHYLHMLNYARDNDLSQSTRYDYMKTLMDVDNYAEYQAFQILINNRDWPHNNIDFWRYKTEAYTPDAPHGHDGRWRWIIFDTDYGFWRGDYGPWENTLELATRPNRWETDLFRNMLENKNFSNLFINRLADYMNACFHPDTINALVDAMQNVYDPVIDDHIDRWHRIETRENWFSEIEKLKNFGQQRPAHMRDHILTHFNLEGEYRLTLKVASGKGKIRINSITTGDMSNWSGLYFKGVPVEVEAIADPSYRFSHWEGFLNSQSEILSIDTSEDVSLDAHFEFAAETALLNFWVFDEAMPNNQALVEVVNTYHLSHPAKIEFHSALPDYPYTSSHPLWRKASMERRNMPTPINYHPAGNSNKSYESAGIRGLQIKQPFRSNDRENMLVLHLPTIGYRDIVLKLAVLDENAASGLLVDYMEAGSWQTTGSFSFDINNQYQLISLDLSSVAQANNNPHLKIRIRFTGPNMDADLGNRVTFNNVSLHGTPMEDFNHPPVVAKEPGLLTAIEGGADVTIDLKDYFFDPEGETLSYTMVSSRIEIAAVQLNNDILTLTPAGRGDALITVRGSDGVNSAATAHFRILVYPSAHPLNKGAFVFDEWDAHAPEMTYPQNMLFLQSDKADPGMNTPLLYPYHISHNDYHANDQATIGFPYNNTGRSRINGLGENGISLINTGRDRDLGGVLVAVDTRGEDNWRVKWSAGTLQKNDRLYAIRLQYRVGTEGPFYDVVQDGSVWQYIAGDSDRVFPIINIPAAALDQPYVQFLWKYYHITGDSGARSQLWIDDISIGRLLSDDAWIQSFCFKEIATDNLVIDHQNLVVDVGLEPGTPITSLTPVLTWSDHATLDPAPGAEGFSAMDFSQPVFFTVTSQSGININQYKIRVDNGVFIPGMKPQEIKVYPNPAQHRLMVNSGSIMRTVELINLSGRVVYSKQLMQNEYTLKVGDNPAGIYFLRIQSDEGVHVTKVQITRQF